MKQLSLFDEPTPQPTAVNVNFLHLEPLDPHCCQSCTGLYLDIERGYYCKRHKEVYFKGNTNLVAVNDCSDWEPPHNDAVTTTFTRRNK